MCKRAAQVSSSRPPLLGFVVCVLFLAALFADTAQAQGTGLLLGLRYEEPVPQVPPYYAGRADSLSRSAYRTLLITRRENDTFGVVGDTKGLFVPRSNGFWRVDAKRSVYNDWVEDFVWSTPVTAPRRLPGIESFNGEYCRGYRRQTILYAGADYLALDQHSAGYCEGAAHPWALNTLAFIPLDSLGHLGLPITKILGRPGLSAFSSAVEQFLANVVDEAQRDRYAQEPDEVNWALRRAEGRWIVEGRLDYAAEFAQGTYADLPLALEAPPSLVGYNRLDPSWAAIKAYAPDARDAFTSPFHDMVVLLRRNRLTVHPMTRGQIGQAALTVRLGPGAAAVMARWAVGPPLQRWTERLRPSNTASQ